MTECKQGFALWITGLPGSGKSTLSARLAKKLANAGIHTQILESDVMRDLLTPGLGYGVDDRDRFYHLLIVVGELLVRNGVNVIFDATAGQRRFREEARQMIAQFAEVYVNCPLEECERRDPKHIYEKARQGLYHDVPGVQAPYEPPLEPEAEVDSTSDDPEHEAEKVMKKLQKLGFLNLE
jgi:adenylylsulfate kinase